MTDRSAIVVGAGITGVSTAEWMRRDGWHVTLVDRVRPGSPEQTSYGNAGVLASASVVPVSTPGLALKVPGMLLDPDSPLFLRWSHLPRMVPWFLAFLRQGRRERVMEIAKALSGIAYDSVEQHQTLADGTAAAKFIHVAPYVYVYKDRKAYEGDLFGHALRREHGFPSEEIDGPELRAADPALSDSVGFGVSYGNHGYISSPSGYTAALADHFLATGGRFEEGEVADITPNEAGGEVALADGRRLAGDKIVLSAGVWSRAFAEKLGHRTPMVAERGHHLMLHGASARPPYPTMVAAGKFVLTPMDDGLRAAGTAEFGPIDAPPSDAALSLLRRQLKRVYPGLTWEREETWMGRRPSTVDSLPMIGASPKAPHVIFAFGAQHIGLTLGARTGRMVAEIAAGRSSNVDLSPFRPDRFD